MYYTVVYLKHGCFRHRRNEAGYVFTEVRLPANVFPGLIWVPSLALLAEYLPVLACLVLHSLCTGMETPGHCDTEAHQA
jgi:hypothetical protein